jgi:hypothetical protein
MEMYSGRDCKTPRILNPGTRWSEWLGSRLLGGMLNGPQIQSGCGGKNSHCPCQESNSHHPAHSQSQTELPRLNFDQESAWLKIMILRTFYQVKSLHNGYVSELNEYGQRKQGTVKLIAAYALLWKYPINYQCFVNICIHPWYCLDDFTHCEASQYLIYIYWIQTSEGVWFKCIQLPLIASLWCANRVQIIKCEDKIWDYISR